MPSNSNATRTARRVLAVAIAAAVMPMTGCQSARVPDSATARLAAAGAPGGEFVGVIGKVEDLRTGNPADVPAEFLPEEARVARGGAPSPDAPVVLTAPPVDNALVEAEEAVTTPLRRAADPAQLTLTNPIF